MCKIDLHYKAHQQWTAEIRCVCAQHLTDVLVTSCHWLQVRTAIALLSAAVWIALLIGVVVPPVSLFVLVILVFVHLFFVNHQVRHLRQTPDKHDSRTSACKNIWKKSLSKVLDMFFFSADWNIRRNHCLKRPFDGEIRLMKSIFKMLPHVLDKVTFVLYLISIFFIVLPCVSHWCS